MPPAPAFDYYEALEVEKDANTEAITASYRRLARVHHPDKDPENPDATANFQQVRSHPVLRLLACPVLIRMETDFCYLI
jgi:DnaJ-class molecular chaperone